LRGIWKNSRQAINRRRQVEERMAISSPGRAHRRQVSGDTRTGEPIVISVPEAARLAGLSRQSAYEAARRGDIPTIRIGRRILVPREKLIRLLCGDDSS
jgi:excisionase family DNA binding protein